MSALRVAAFAAAALFAWPGSICRAHIADNFESVHFNSGQPDFGTLPRRGILLGEFYVRPDVGTSMGSADEHGAELSTMGDQNRQDRLARLIGGGLAAARKHEASGQWDRAARVYAWLGRQFGWKCGPRNLRDRMETLSAAAAHPLPPRAEAALRRYLRALDLYEQHKWTDANAALAAVCADPEAGLLRDRARYQLASLAYEWLDYPRALALYQAYLRDCPTSPKREAALIMAARSALLSPQPQGRNVAVGQAALAQLSREYPRTRFAHSARRLAGRVLFLTGRYRRAIAVYFSVDDLASVEQGLERMPRNAEDAPRARLLAAYLRRMARARTYEAYARAASDIVRTRKLMSPAAAARFAGTLPRDLDVAAAYLYYRLYHCDNSKAELANLVRLADAIAGERGRASLPPLVRIRLAEVYYQRGRYRAALAWARGADVPPVLDRSLYVQAASLEKMHRFGAARAPLGALLDRCPRSALRIAARELLAIAYERTGRNDLALDQYMALRYPGDIAFLLDVRMAPAEIERYIAGRPGLRRWTVAYEPTLWEDGRDAMAPHSMYGLAAYSLGMRYLRREQWRSAATWFRRVPHREYVAFSKGRKEWADRPSPEPLTVIARLSRLQARIERTRSRAQRAAARFRYASYYYRHGTLLLYNAALWRGEREESWAFWWNGRVATLADKSASRTYMYEHEVYARTLAMCRDIADRYPDSPVAPQALYRAACSARWLANFNGWWREEDKRQDHWREAQRLMKRLARTYPHSPLAHNARKYAGVFANEARGMY